MGMGYGVLQREDWQMTLQAAISSDHDLYCLGCGTRYPASEQFPTRGCPDHQPVTAHEYIAELRSRIDEMLPVIVAAMHTVDLWRWGTEGTMVNHNRLKPAIDEYRMAIQQ
jgi:hypothetical protein